MFFIHNLYSVFFYLWSIFPQLILTTIGFLDLYLLAPHWGSVSTSSYHYNNKMESRFLRICIIWSTNNSWFTILPMISCTISIVGMYCHANELSTKRFVFEMVMHIEFMESTINYRYKQFKVNKFKLHCNKWLWKKYFEIDWLQNVDTIQLNELFPYISNNNDVSNNCD